MQAQQTQAPARLPVMRHDPEALQRAAGPGYEPCLRLCGNSRSAAPDQHPGGEDQSPTQHHLQGSAQKGRLHKAVLNPGNRP